MNVGSLQIGGLIAHVLFWVLLVVGWQELGSRKAMFFVACWLAGYAGLPLVHGELFFMPLVAVLDIVLVLMIFGGNLR